MILKESNVLSLVDELDNITYWCKNIVQLYTNDSSFKKDISSFYNSLSGEEQEKLFDKIENISGTVHKMYKILDSIDEEIDLRESVEMKEDVTDTFVWMCQNKYVALPRNEIKKVTDKIVSKFIDWNDVPTMAAACDHVDDLVDSGTKQWAEQQREILGPDCEILTIYDIAKNIQNLVSFNLNDDLDESVEYTDTIDAIKDNLERQFPELLVSIVNKPRCAVRVESEKVLDDDNTLFNETFYIFEGPDGRIKAVREHDKPVVFVDVDGVINFFNDYLNS